MHTHGCQCHGRSCMHVQSNAWHILHFVAIIHTSTPWFRLGLQLISPMDRGIRILCIRYLNAEDEQSSVKSVSRSSNRNPNVHIKWYNICTTTQNHSRIKSSAMLQYHMHTAFHYINVDDPDHSRIIDLYRNWTADVDYCSWSIIDGHTMWCQKLIIVVRI